MENINNAAKMAEFKYPAHQYTVAWHFDQSSCHKAYAEVPKGMKRERGINSTTMVADDMRTVLANHEDFRTEKTLVEHFLTNRGHKVFLTPKFHCELNPIERGFGGKQKNLLVHTPTLHFYD